MESGEKIDSLLSFSIIHAKGNLCKKWINARLKFLVSIFQSDNNDDLYSDDKMLSNDREMNPEDTLIRILTIDNRRLNKGTINLSLGEQNRASVHEKKNDF